MTLSKPPSLPSRASWICCGDARPFADKRLSWPSFSSRVMRASSESRLWAAIGVASKTAKSRLLQMRNMEQVSGAREIGSRSYGAIRHSEGLALSPTPWASLGQLAHLSRRSIYAASSFSVARLHHAPFLPSLSQRTNHHRYRSRLREGSERSGGSGRRGFRSEPRKRRCAFDRDSLGRFLRSSGLGARPV